ncbi:MAG: hypothetical protein Q7S56_01065 [Nanoarchaeota archaeon]|nr:hypothetical protein [Nanoarchaeota archaeon]
MRMIKGKKGEGEGILPGETVKIIIAVIGIAALFYLAVSLYGIFNNKTEIEQAKASLNEIVQKVNVLKDGQNGDVLITGPKSSLLYYITGAQTTSFCNSEKPCICICLNPDNNHVCNQPNTCQITNFNYKIADNGVIGNTQYVNWLGIGAPVALTLKKQGTDVIVSLADSNVPIDNSNQQSGQQQAQANIVNDLLQQKINFNGQSIVYKDFLTQNVFNNCNLIDYSKISPAVKSQLQSFSYSYVEGLRQKGLVSGRTAIVYWIGQKKFIQIGAQKELQEIDFYGDLSKGITYFEKEYESGKYDGTLSFTQVLNRDQLNANYYLSDTLSFEQVCNSDNYADYVFVVEDSNAK